MEKYTETLAESNIKKGLSAWTDYLKKFDDAEKHAPTLFWAAYCWGATSGSIATT